MDLGRLRIGDWATALAALALIAVMFMDWYGVKGTGDSGAPAANAWEAFSVLDIVLALAAAWALAGAIATATQHTPAVPIAMMSVTTFLALFALIWLLFRVAFPPDAGLEGADTTRLEGMWLGLGAAASLLVGALAAIRDESPSLRAPAPHEAPDRPPTVPVTRLPAPRPGGERVEQ